MGLHRSPRGVIRHCKTLLIPPSAPPHPGCRSPLSTLAILEQQDGRLNHGSLSAVSAARKLGGPVHGFVAGSKAKEIAQEATKIEGVEKIISVANGAYDKVRT